MGDIAYDERLTAVVQVSNLDAAISWYNDVLGFGLIYRQDEMGWAEVQPPVGGTSLGLSQMGEPGKAGGATLTWGVKDIAAARASMEAKGVTFAGPNDEMPGMVILATFSDLDGNEMMLAQSLMDGQPNG